MADNSDNISQRILNVENNQAIKSLLSSLNSQAANIKAVKTDIDETNKYVSDILDNISFLNKSKADAENLKETQSLLKDVKSTLDSTHNNEYIDNKINGILLLVKKEVAPQVESYTKELYKSIADLNKRLGGVTNILSEQASILSDVKNKPAPLPVEKQTIINQVIDLEEISKLKKQIDGLKDKIKKLSEGTVDFDKIEDKLFNKLSKNIKTTEQITFVTRNGIQRLSQLTDVNANVDSAPAGYVLTYDGISQWYAAAGGGGGGVPAGSNTDVQFNDAGAFGADTGVFTYDKTTGTLASDNFAVHEVFVRDSVDWLSNSFYVRIQNSDPTTTADRTLSFRVNNASRTLNMGGNIVTAGNFTTAGAFAMTLTATASTSITLPTTGTLSTLAGAESLTNKKLGSLTTNGFVKTSAGDGTLSVDTNTYLTTASATSTYLPLAGGTLTGNLLFSADNTLDIGASGATRARTLYLGTSVFAPTVTGDTASGGTLTLSSTSNATKGKILFGTSAYDEVNNLLGIKMTPISTWGALQILSTGLSSITMTDSVTDTSAKQGLFTGAPYTNANTPWTGLGLTDNNTIRNMYYGGGSWGKPDAMAHRFYTAPTYTQSNNTGVLRFIIMPDGSVGINEPAPTSKLQIKTNALGTTTTVASGALIQNATAAANAAQQISPPTTWEGQGWASTGGTSQSIKFSAYVLPLQGTTAASGDFILGRDFNAAGTFTETMAFSYSPFGSNNPVMRLATANVIGFGAAQSQLFFGSSGFTAYNQAGSVAFLTSSGAGNWTYTPTSLTGSQATSVLTINQTWNTSGAPTLILANVTNTASGAGLLMDLQVGAVSQFKVSKAGTGTFAGAVSAAASGSSFNGLTSSALLTVNSSAGIRSPAMEGGNAAGSALTLYSTSNASASGDYIAFSTGNSGGTEGARFLSNGNFQVAKSIIMNGAASVIRLKGYTVAGLPAGTQGDTAYCTDLLAPTFGATAVGGGAVALPVFFDGTNWKVY